MPERSVAAAMAERLAAWPFKTPVSIAQPIKNPRALLDRRAFSDGRGVQ